MQEASECIGRIWSGCQRVAASLVEADAKHSLSMQDSWGIITVVTSLSKYKYPTQDTDNAGVINAASLSSFESREPLAVRMTGTGVTGSMASS